MLCMFFFLIFYEKMDKNIAVPPTASHNFMGTKSICTLYSRK